MITREGIPRHRSTANQGQCEDLGRNGHGTLVSSLPCLALPTHPAKAHHAQGTCVEDTSKDPALAILDWPEARLFPFLEDLHTAIPVPWVPAIWVITAPVSSNHTVVIIAIDLHRNPHTHPTPEVNQYHAFPRQNLENSMGSWEARDSGGHFSTSW